MNTLETIKTKLNAFELQRKELVKKLQKDFPQIVKPLFEKSEKINSIGWTQYTPYFSDGDECVFSTHIDASTLIVNGCHLDYDELEEEEDFFNEQIWKEKGYQPNPYYIKKEWDILEEFSSVLSEIPDDFYKELFGDHITVTITKEGAIEVEEYEHD